MKKILKKGLSVLFAAAFVCTMASCGKSKDEKATIYNETKDGVVSYQLSEEETDKVKNILLEKSREYLDEVPRCFMSYGIYIVVGDAKVYLSGDDCNVALECDVSDNLNDYNNDGFRSFSVSSEDFEYLKSLYENHLDSTPWM